MNKKQKKKASTESTDYICHCKIPNLTLGDGACLKCAGKHTVGAGEKMGQHTPMEIDYLVDEDGFSLCEGTCIVGLVFHHAGRSKARSIVRAVNAHEALLEIAKKLIGLLPSNEGLGGHAPMQAFIALADRAKKAIVLAEGRTTNIQTQGEE